MIKNDLLKIEKELPKLHILIIPALILSVIILGCLILSRQIEPSLLKTILTILPLTLLTLAFTNGYAEMDNNKYFVKIIEDEKIALPNDKKGLYVILFKVAIPILLTYFLLINQPYNGLIQIIVDILMLLFITWEIFRSLKAMVHSKIIERSMISLISDLDKSKKDKHD